MDLKRVPLQGLGAALAGVLGNLKDETDPKRFMVHIPCNIWIGLHLKDEINQVPPRNSGFAVPTCKGQWVLKVRPGFVGFLGFKRGTVWDLGLVPGFGFFRVSAFPGFVLRFMSRAEAHNVG